MRVILRTPAAAQQRHRRERDAFRAKVQAGETVHSPVRMLTERECREYEAVLLARDAARETP